MMLPMHTSSPVISAFKLSDREMQVLKLLAEGYSNPEIATSLCISISTVKTHVRNIMNKFGVNHRIQAVVLAVRSGLVH
jgi:two-component system, NarL family, response regulator LiaR